MVENTEDLRTWVVDGCGLKAWADDDRIRCSLLVDNMLFEKFKKKVKIVSRPVLTDAKAIRNEVLERILAPVDWLMSVER